MVSAVEPLRDRFRDNFAISELYDEPTSLVNFIIISSVGSYNFAIACMIQDIAILWLIWDNINSGQSAVSVFTVIHPHRI